MDAITYSRRERVFLWLLAVVGVVGVNGTFLYGYFSDPTLLEDALRNPISLAFLTEAFLILGALAYLLTRWRVSRLHWIWFLVFALLGSMAFALPAVILWPWTKTKTPAQP